MTAEPAWGRRANTTSKTNMKRQKLRVLAAVVLGGLIACSSATLAQDAKGERKGPRSADRAAMVQQRVDSMSKELNLNAEQKKKVTSLLEAQGKKMQEMRDLPQEERRTKMKGFREEQDKKMKEILTADQFEKWQKSRLQRGPEGKGERKGEGKGEGKKKS